MFTDEDEHAAAVEYYCKIMTDGDVLMLKNLFSRIPKVSPTARRYLHRHCRKVHELEEFFVDNSHIFFVENGRVALYHEKLEIGRNEAVRYFKEKVETYRDPVHYVRLKNEQLEHAPDEVADFITSFYPGKSFKRFLRSRPDVFVVYPDNSVFLIDTEAVAFYEKSLETGIEKKLPFLNFRGRIGQAPPHIQEYVNKYYHGDDFQIFLRKHNDVFVLDHELNVSLVPIE